jgi:hypothetical protein
MLLLYIIIIIYNNKFKYPHFSICGSCLMGRWDDGTMGRKGEKRPDWLLASDY